MRTVLFADDMEEVRAVSCAALQQHGYIVLAARDGFEALSLAREHRDPVELLITDVMMPRLVSGRPADERDEAASVLQKPFAPRVPRRGASELLSERRAARDFRFDGLHI
jgi:CheY-like chemotaxis protein